MPTGSEVGPLPTDWEVQLFGEALSPYSIDKPPGGCALGPLKMGGCCLVFSLSHKNVVLLTKMHIHTVDGRNPAPPGKPWDAASPVNTNKQWFRMVSNCREMGHVHLGLGPVFFLFTVLSTRRHAAFRVLPRRCGRTCSICQ